MPDPGTQTPQDQLSQLIMSLPRQGSPLAGLPPVAPGAPPVGPAFNAADSSAAQAPPQAGLVSTGAVSPGSTNDLENRVSAARVPQATPTPQPSDDPTLKAGMQALSQNADAFNQRAAKVQADQDALNKLQAPKFADNKPKWYDRLLGGAVGFGLGWGGKPGEGAELGGDLTRRGFNNATSEYQRQRDQLMQTLNQDRDTSLLSAAGEAANRNFEGAKGVATLNQNATKEEDKKAQDAAMDAIKDEIAKNNLENAKDKLDQRDRELDLRERLGDDVNAARKEVADARMELADKARDKSGDPATPGAKPTQFLSNQNKRDAAWGKAQSAYNKAIRDIDPHDEKGLQQARDEYYEQLQEAQNDYEQGITTLGGSAEHIEIPHNHFGEPPVAGAPQPPQATTAQAQPPSQPSSSAPPPTLWNGRPKNTLALNNPTTGKKEYWVLQNGVPTKTTPPKTPAKTPAKGSQ